MANAVIIDNKDTVAVAIEQLNKGTDAEFRMPDGSMQKVTLIDDIQIYHKFAVKEMKKGDPVIKYGEHIGIASADIKIGNHVHTHNVADHRENLDNA